MKNIIISIAIIFLSMPSYSNKVSEFEEAQEIIELRKATMQGIWARVKRLAPFIDLDDNMDYSEDLAKQDAEDIKLLLEKSIDLWPRSTNLSTRNLTNATPAIWAVEDYFYKLYDRALLSAGNLEKSLESNNWDQVDIDMCNLGNACGTCHASFRRLLTSELANEASAWSGKYTKKCN